MRIAKVGVTIGKKSSANPMLGNRHHSSVLIVKHEDDEDEDEDFNVSDDNEEEEEEDDEIIQPNFSLGDPGELCLGKVHDDDDVDDGLLSGISTDEQLTVLPAESEDFTTTQDLMTRTSSRRVAARQKAQAKQEVQQISTRSSVATKRKRSPGSKVPKVTLKLGNSTTPTPTTTTTPTVSRNSKTKMKSKPITRHSLAATVAAPISHDSNSNSPGSQQVSSSAARTGDHEATTNPPSNSSSSGMVNSPHQYVTITVDGEGGVVTEGGVNVGESTPSYVTYLEDSADHSSIYAAAAAAAANGQTMAYPVYNVGSEGGIYSSASAQYYSPNNSTTSYVPGDTDGGEEIGEGRALTTAEINCILSGGESSAMSSSSPEADHDVMHLHHRQALLDGGVYMVPTASGNGNGGSASDGGGPSHGTRVSPTTVSVIGGFRRNSENNELKRKPSLSATNRQEEVLQSQMDSVMMNGDENTNTSNDMDTSSSEDEDDGYEEINPNAVPPPSAPVTSQTLDNNHQLDDGAQLMELSALLSDADMKTLSKLYPMNNSNPLFSSTSFKTCPDTVQWLLDNYETAEGVSLPRSTLYNHYLRHCSDHKLDPVNAASFGKLIRSVFLGLRTRRLGTRGNSKYHYYGIRLKPTSPLVNLPEDFHHLSSNSHSHGRHNSSSSGGGRENGASISNKRLKIGKSESYDGNHTNGFSAGDTMTVQQYLGDSTGALDDFPELDLDAELPEGLEDNDLHIFGTIYKEHCETLLEAVARFQMGQLEMIWKCFWRSSATEGSESSLDYEKVFPKEKLLLICQMKAIQEFVKEVDFMLYQKIVTILLPDVLRPIPSTMTQAIRNCAKTLENWMTASMFGYSDDFVSLKISIVTALAQTLRRYTSLNHLAQAARAVLQNENQISQMLSDLNRVDFHNVEEQASWVCGGTGNFVPNLEQDFKATLAQQQSLEQWAAWLEGVVDRVLRPYANTPGYVQTARHFLLKWSFYSSLIIRDLTLRSAASFGSFHLLRLLYDEYMFFLVEHRVAVVKGVVPIAVIGQKHDDRFDESNGSSESQPLLKVFKPLGSKG